MGCSLLFLRGFSPPSRVSVTVVFSAPVMLQAFVGHMNTPFPPPFLVSRHLKSTVVPANAVARFKKEASRGSLVS